MLSDRSLFDHTLINLAFSPRKLRKLVPPHLQKHLKNLKASFDSFSKKFGKLADLPKRQIVLKPSGALDLEATVKGLQPLISPIKFLRLAILSGINIDLQHLWEKMTPCDRINCYFELERQSDSLGQVCLLLFDDRTVALNDAIFTEAIRSAVKNDALFSLKFILEKSPQMSAAEGEQIFQDLNEEPSRQMRAFIDAFCAKLQ